MLRNCIREDKVQGSLESEDTGENWSSAGLTGEGEH